MRTLAYTQFLGPDAGSGVYLLDLAVGMIIYSFSLLVLDIAARLPTVASHDQETAVLELFIGRASIADRRLHNDASTVYQSARLLARAFGWPDTQS